MAVISFRFAPRGTRSSATPKESRVSTTEREIPQLIVKVSPRHAHSPTQTFPNVRNLIAFDGQSRAANAAHAAGRADRSSARTPPLQACDRKPRRRGALPVRLSKRQLLARFGWDRRRNFFSRYILVDRRKRGWRRCRRASVPPSPRRTDWRSTLACGRRRRIAGRCA